RYFHAHSERGPTQSTDPHSWIRPLDHNDQSAVGGRPEDKSLSFGAVTDQQRFWSSRRNDSLLAGGALCAVVGFHGDVAALYTLHWTLGSGIHADGVESCLFPRLDYGVHGRRRFPGG